QGKLEDIDIRPSRSIKLRDEQQVRGWVVALLVLLAIVVGLAVWWLEGGDLAGILAPAPPAESSAPAPVPAAAMPANGGSSAARASSDEAPPADVQLGSDAVRAAESTAPAGAPDSTSAAGSAAESAGSGADTGGSTASPQAQAGAPLRPLEFAVDVELAFDQDSWTEITDARGERLFYGTGAAGRSAKLRGEPPFAVVLGNVDGVRMKVEGADYEIPRPKQGNFARFSLTINED
ncbi:MAG TPA: DUF4115 domain-containing protein, partial [Gammaproteobacteria bacterium]|nr:DUF4115 domain-containing protein [Gammaproteobacteria bacterium]